MFLNFAIATAAIFLSDELRHHHKQTHTLDNFAFLIENC
jgi:hypothetical protein